MPRVFVAVQLGTELAAAVGDTQQRLRPQLARVKWVEPHNLHLTLRFFGEVGEDQVDVIAKVVRAVSKSHTAFPVALEGIGCFPERGRPRVIWIAVTDGAAELATLAAELDTAFGAAELGREARPFRPHLTIGRLRDERGRQASGPAQDNRAIRTVLDRARFARRSAVIDEVAVVESLLGRRGPTYIARAVAALGQGGAETPGQA